MKPLIVFLFLNLPLYCFSQDTIQLHSGEKIAFDRIFKTPYHIEYDKEGARYFLALSDFDNIIRGVPKNIYSFYFFYGFGSVGNGFYSLATDIEPPGLPSGVFYYEEHDWEGRNFMGGALFQWGHRLRSGKMAGVMGGLESFGRPYEYYNYNRFTNYSIRYGAGAYFNYIHFSLSPFYRIYLLRNNFFLEGGPFAGLIKYTYDTHYTKYNSEIGIDEHYSAKKNIQTFHPGLMAGAGLNLEYKKNYVLSLVVQCHFGFGIKVDRVQDQHFILIPESNLKYMQFLFGLSYGLR